MPAVIRKIEMRRREKCFINRIMQDIIFPPNCD